MQKKLKERRDASVNRSMNKNPDKDARNKTPQTVGSRPARAPESPEDKKSESVGNVLDEIKQSKRNIK